MPTPYSIPAYAPAEIQDEHPNLWATLQKFFSDLSDDRKAVIGALVVNTCPACHNADNRCKCWDNIIETNMF